MSDNFLPLILVSAFDLASASKLISEIVDNEVCDSGAQRRGRRGGRVWRVLNKYYSADVELVATGEGAATTPHSQLLEAHIIYVTEQEAEECAAERRLQDAGEAVRSAHVRLVVTPGPSVSDALASWARRRGYEPVALMESPDSDDDDDTVGMLRVRDALHAHTWRGLRRLDRASPTAGVALEGSETEWSDGEDAVERAEAFATALGALADARAYRESDDAERRARAERLVAAFCRALGADLPRL